MRAETLTQGIHIAIRAAKAGPTKWERMSEGLNRFFQHQFESECERTTGQPWKEWLRLEDRIPVAIQFIRKKWT